VFLEEGIRYEWKEMGAPFKVTHERRGTWAGEEPVPRV
jgi:hypothetical protein